LPSLENEYVEYKLLIIKESKGKDKYYFDEDLDTEQIFIINNLLEGHLNEKVISEKNILEHLIDISANIKDAKNDIKEIKDKLDVHYQYLITLPQNKDIKSLIGSTQQLSNT
tara:strand:+ start:4249 stop:4584 length:336 start_codon:yes stop_codon:yes gene_type:complete